PFHVIVGGQVNSFGTGAAQIWETLNAGMTWTDISVLSGKGPHSEQHTITFDSAGIVYFGGDGGIWKYDRAAGSWNDLNSNLAITQINSVSTNPTQLNSMIAGSRMNGIALYTGNVAWDRVDVVPATPGNAFNGGQVQYNPKNGNIVYAVGSNPSNALSTG